MRRHAERSSEAFLTLALVTALGCGAGQVGSADAGAGADAGYVPPPPTPSSCAVDDTQEAVDVCGGTAACLQKRFVTFRCSHFRNASDLALTPDGHAFATITTSSHDRGAFLMEAPAAGAPRVTSLGPAEVALVAVDAAGEPAVLLWSGGAQGGLARRVNGAFTTVRVSLPVERPLAFAIGGQGGALLTRGPGGFTLAGVPGDGRPPTVITQEVVSSFRLFVDGQGEPVVVYAVSSGTERIYRRWKGGVAVEIGRVQPQAEDDAAIVLLPGGKVGLTRMESGTAFLLEEPGLERLLFEAAPWTGPSCNGSTVAYYPDLCPTSDQAPIDVGEQATHAHAAAGTAAGARFTATILGHLKVGCGWAGSCIETMPCQCNLQMGTSLTGPLTLELRRLDGTGGKRLLSSPLSPEGSVVRYAVDERGYHHLAWTAYGVLSVATVELTGF
jgi:hypothetical protein